MFIYLNKKIAIPNGIKLRCCQWNQEQGWIACGGEGGLLKVLKLESSGTGRERGIAGVSNLTMNQTLEGHTQAVVCAAWNDVYKKLTTSDETGLIIVWMLHNGMWFEEMINNRNKSVVRDMKWCADGLKICICYEDGAVIVGSVDGNRLWGKELKMKLQFCEWSPDAKQILFVTPQGEVHVFDALGNFISQCPLFSEDSSARIAGVAWYNQLEGLVDEAAPSIAIVFETGRVQLMTSTQDEKPILIDTGLRPATEAKIGNKVHIAWNSNGSVLAVGGVLDSSSTTSEDKNVSQMQFYDAFGRHLRTLKLPGAAVSGLAWEGGSLRIALAVESFLYFANIRPDYKWGYFANTLVYAYTRADRAEHCVTLHDTVTGNKYTKYVKKLLQIKAAGDYCVLATRTDDPSVYLLILCNAIGAPVDSKYVSIELQYLVMTKQHVVCASEDSICVWQYSSKVAKLTSIEGKAAEVALKKKDGKEVVWHVDESPSTSSTAGSEHLKSQKRAATQDAITCIAASDCMLLVGRESGTVQRYSLPHIALEAKYILRCCPQALAINCSSTRMSIIDINGVISFYDMEVGRGKSANEQGVPPGEHLAFEKRDAWDMVWAEDNDELMVMMEKSRMYIYRGLQPEEPVVSSGYLCRFTDLSVTIALLDDIFAAVPEPPEQECIVHLETKSLRDSRDILAKVGIADASVFIEDNSHPRLWNLLAEAALEKLDFATAERAFVKTGDYNGVQLVKRLQHLGDKAKQKAEVAIYFKRFDEAEKAYKDMDRLDLAIDMRARLGDWFRVMHLASAGGSSDDMLKAAYLNIGDYYFDRLMWAKAHQYYQNAGNVERQIPCLYNLENFEQMAKFASDPEFQLAEGSPLLITIGERLASVGLAEDAVAAFLRGQDVKAAIDCCVLLNQWDKAVTLAEEHDFPQIEGLLSKYAQHLLSNGRRMEAVELYRKANRQPEAARLLSEMAVEEVKARANPKRARSLFVLAALEVEKFRDKTLKVVATGTMATMQQTMAGKATMAGGKGKPTMAAGGAKGTMATMQTLDGLMQGDSAAADNKILDRAWRGVEAMELLVLTHKLLYTGESRVDAAMKHAMALADYDDILEPEMVYSLIALTAFHNQMYGTCSNALMRLEQLEGVSQERRDAYQALSFKIFTRFKPKNPGITEDMKKKDLVTPETKAAIRKKYKALCASAAAKQNP